MIERRAVTTNLFFPLRSDHRADIPASRVVVDQDQRSDVSETSVAGTERTDFPCLPNRV